MAEDKPPRIDRLREIVAEMADIMRENDKGLGDMIEGLGDLETSLSEADQATRAQFVELVPVMQSLGRRQALFNASAARLCALIGNG